MARVVDHLSVAELEARCEGCEDVTSLRHFQTIFLLAKGHSTREVADITSFGQRWIEQLLERYNAFGPASLGDQRRDNRGVATVLKPELLERLRVRLSEPPPDGGLWTSAKVARWMADELGLEKLAAQRGWEALKAIGWSIQKPRPRNPKAASAEEQDAFKKSRRDRRQRSRGASRHPRRSVRDRRTSPRIEANIAMGVGAHRRAPDRARPSSLPMALRHGVRFPGYRRKLLVHFQRRLEAVLRGPVGDLRPGSRGWPGSDHRSRARQRRLAQRKQLGGPRGNQVGLPSCLHPRASTRRAPLADRRRAHRQQTHPGPRNPRGHHFRALRSSRQRPTNPKGQSRLPLVAAHRQCELIARKPYHSFQLLFTLVGDGTRAASQDAAAT